MTGNKSEDGATGKTISMKNTRTRKELSHRQTQKTHFRNVNIVRVSILVPLVLLLQLALSVGVYFLLG